MTTDSTADWTPERHREALRPFASRGETGPAADPTSAVVREAEDDERDAGKLGTFLANAMLAGNVVRR